MIRLACAAACLLAAALAPAAWAHAGEVHVSEASVAGPNEIFVAYSGAMGLDQGCAECAGASYSELVLFPGGARDVASVSEGGGGHTVTFGGPAAAADAVARFHLDGAEWSDGAHVHRMSEASASASDGQPPPLIGASLDLDAGAALLEFGERMGGFDASLVSAGGISMSGARGDVQDRTVRLSLGEKLRSDLSALEAVEMEAGAGAFEDAAGNASAEFAALPGVAPDRTPPEALWSESVLDLGAGTLLLVFDEYVDASSVDASAVSIGDGAGTHRVGLDGAAVRPDGYADRLTLELVGPQKAAATDTNFACGAPFELDCLAVPPEEAAADPDFDYLRLRPVSSFPQPSPGNGLDVVRIGSGVRDAAGLGVSGGAAGGLVQVVADAEAPAVLGPPVLDMGEGSVRVEFDEHIDAYNADLDAMVLRSGGWSAPLSTGIASSNGYALVAYVDRAELASAGPAFELEIGDGAVSDLSGNGLAGSVLEVDARQDREPPALVHAYINAASGVLTAEFDEPVGADVSPAHFSLREDGHSSHRVRMYSSADYEADGASVRITLTPQQKQDVSSFVARAVLDMSTGAVRDLSGNANERGSVAASVSGDSRPPEPSSASLDAGTGLLVISFDEPMDFTPESVVLEALILRSGGAAIPMGTDSVRASVSVDHGEVSLKLAERQRQWVISHGAPLSLEVGAGAARDASANPVARQHDLQVQTDATDSAGPSPLSAVLDMGNGLMTVFFDEHVGELDTSKLVLRGPPGSGQELSAAQALPPGGSSAPVQLVIEQGRAVSPWPQVVLDAGAGAAQDTSGNPSAAAEGVPVEILPDRTPPEMLSASLSGPDRIAVVFSEDLYDPSVSASDFEIGGRGVAGASDDGGTVTVTLSERVRSSDGKALRVELVGNVADEHGNLMQTRGDPPYADAPNDLSFAGAESFTVGSDNALSAEYAKAGDTITVALKTDAPIDSASVTVNSNEANVEQERQGLVARYLVSDSDSDGPADISVTVHAAGGRGGTSSFDESDADGSVTIDTTMPEYVSASLAGSNSLYVHYSEPVRSEVTQYLNVAVGSGDPGPAVFVGGSGTQDILVEWDGDKAGPNSPEITFEIDDSVSDLAGNALSNPGEQSMDPPSSEGALALLRVAGDGRVALARDTFVEQVAAPGGAVIDVEDFGPPALPDPVVDGAGGSAVQFPPKALVVETDKSRVTFPPGLQAGGFGGDRVIVVRDSDSLPDGEFASANPDIDPGAAVVLEFGSPGEDIALSVPVLIQFKDLIEEESVVFSIDADGDTRELLGCTGSVNTETAAEYISSNIRLRGSATVDGGACVDKDEGVVWTAHFSSFGTAVPAADAPDCDGDCTPPTFGVSASGTRIVSGGFEYNGRASDVELFFTEYPAVTAEVGKTNTAVLKVYDDSGPGAVEHVGIAFGLREGEAISESLAEISWDVGGSGRGQVTLFDPAGAIDPDSVGVDSSLVPCAPGSSDTCLQLEILHAFRAPLEFDMVGTDAWDRNGNEWQNYYNHAVHVEGGDGGRDGVLVNGGQLLLHQIGAGLDVMADGGGFLYKLTGDGTYAPLTNSSSLFGGSDDSWRAHEGHEDRREAAFREAIAAQALAAQGIADRITGGSVSNPEFGMPAELLFFEETHGSRADDAALQDALAAERQRAAELARLLFDLD